VQIDGDTKASLRSLGNGAWRNCRLDGTAASIK
jgi:hypothetical protein